jgi:hypothetical protein
VKPFPRNQDHEQRREQRLAADTAVTVTVLRVLGEPKASGTVIDMSGTGLRLNLPLPIPCGAQVKVETDGMLLLGEVMRCEPLGLAYSVGLSLSHSMPATKELKRLNRELLANDARVHDAVGEAVRSKP